MDAKLKAKWIKALRSGKYQQCQIELKQSQGNGYCCLGVLCAVAEKKLTDVGAAYRWLDNVTGDYGKFVKMNDDEGASFPEIADYIEANF